MWTPLWVPRSNCCLPSRVLTEIHLKINFSFDSFICHKGLKNKGSETHSNLISARSRMGSENESQPITFPRDLCMHIKDLYFERNAWECLGLSRQRMRWANDSLPFGICFVIPKWWLKRTLFVESRTAWSGNTRVISFVEENREEIDAVNRSRAVNILFSKKFTLYKGKIILLVLGVH